MTNKESEINNREYTEESAHIEIFRFDISNSHFHLYLDIFSNLVPIHINDISEIKEFVTHEFLVDYCQDNEIFNDHSFNLEKNVPSSSSCFDVCHENAKIFKENCEVVYDEYADNRILIHLILY